MFVTFSPLWSPHPSPLQSIWLKQMHLHVHLDYRGLNWPAGETRILDPDPECWLWLWFRLISTQPKGNCCHVPGLTLQLHLLSAEQRSGLESKRLIDLAKALFHNLLTSEMLSYEAKVMEKFSWTFTIFFAHHLRFPASLICGLSVGLFLSRFNGQRPTFGLRRGVL